MKTIKTKPIIFITVSILLLVFSVYFIFNRVNNNKNSDDVLLHASWIEGFDTTEELSKSSDLIIIGEVESQEPELRHDLVFTNHIVTIKDIFSDKRTLEMAEKTKIKIFQTGGTLGKFITPAIIDAPLLQEGETYMLFLRETAEKRFLVMGGTQGAYIIKNGKVISSYGKNNILEEGFKNKDLNLLSEQIKNWNTQ